MWLLFLESYNGISVFHDRFGVSNEDVQLFTDSAARNGLGPVRNMTGILDILHLPSLTP